jgi:hypothetical protein
MMAGKVRAHEPETFLAVLVEKNCESLQIYDSVSLLHLAEQRVENVYEGFWFDLRFYALIECEHSVTHWPID